MMTETVEKRIAIPLAQHNEEEYNKNIEVSVNRNAQNGRHCNGVDRFVLLIMFFVCQINYWICDNL